MSDLFEMDLQLFAEEEETVEEEQQEEQEQIEEEETEQDEQEAEEEETVEEEEVEVKPRRQEKQDHVPLAKYMEERKRRQETERILAQQQAERDRLQLAQEYMNRGWPEAEAHYQANERIRAQQEQQETKDMLFELKIRDLARSDTFYADAETYRDEIKETMREKNVSAEDAYLLLRGKQRISEVRTEEEQRALGRRRQAKDKKPATASPTPQRSPYKLDDVDKKALAGLQKVSPEAGWTVEKYWKLMKET